MIRFEKVSKTYPGQETVNNITTVWNLIVVRADMPDQLAYDIVKTIFDKKDELILVHGEARNFDLKYQRQSASPVPYHPGAAKFFAEKGNANTVVMVTEPGGSIHISRVFGPIAAAAEAASIGS